MIWSSRICYPLLRKILWCESLMAMHRLPSLPSPFHMLFCFCSSIEAHSRPLFVFVSWGEGSVFCGRWSFNEFLFLSEFCLDVSHTFVTFLWDFLKVVP